MKKNSGRDLFHRWEENPLIELADIPFRCNTVFNGTSIKYRDEYLILLRVEGQQGYSFFALARSKDGLHFTVDDKPILLPAKEGPFERYEKFGIEDPRATFLEGTFYIMYTAASGHGPRIALARTDDFQTYERIALISEPGNKDGVLFPEKINGLYVRLDRPIGHDVGSIWISYSKDLVNWGNSKVLITPRGGHWDSYRIGASVPPIRTDYGWLEIYHGVHMTPSGPIYRAGILLLDLEEPSKIISRSDIPSLSPREDYERIGDVGNVVFPCGAIVEDDGEVKLYYGAADTSLCVATTKLEDLLKSVMNS
ncbi:glycoside hydrolase family 130 protein [Candidatus Latescibacterota bacterium]